MMTRAFVGLFLLAQCAGVARAQLQTPDQFYSNGVKIDAWTREDSQRLKYMFWFAKKAPGDLIYRQEVVIVYDAEPDKAYYFDQKTRTFRGRWDLRTETYSLLPAKYQLSRKEDILESMFPPSGEWPTIGDLLRDPDDSLPGAGRPAGGPPEPAPAADSRKLAKMPPTVEFPDLEHSTWESTYLAPGIPSGFSRVRARIVFDGANGKYTPAGTDLVGTFSNVRYERTAAGGFVITGRWSLHGSTGPFRFRIAPDNLTAFEGETPGPQGQLSGTWDGTRRRG